MQFDFCLFWIDILLIICDLSFCLILTEILVLGNRTKGRSRSSGSICVNGSGMILGVI